MERTQGGIRLRPMGLGDLFDETFRLYRRHFLSFVLAMALVSVPTALLTLVLNLLFSSGQRRVQTDPATLLAAGIAAVPLAVLLGLASLLAYALVIRLASAAVLGEHVSVKPAFQAAFGRLLPFVWTMFLYALFSLLLLVTVLGIPFAVYLWLGWGLSGQTCVLERRSGLASLRRSSMLLRNHRWRFIGISLVSSVLVGMLIGLPVGLVSAVGTLVVSMLGLGSNGMLLMQVVNALLSSIAQSLFGAVAYIIPTLLYYDLRVRKEAFDLEQRIAALPAASSMAALA